jgi:hypothetical protein
MVLQILLTDLSYFAYQSLVECKPFKDEKNIQFLPHIKHFRLGYNKRGYVRITCQWGELMERLLQWRSNQYYIF